MAGADLAASPPDLALVVDEDLSAYRDLGDDYAGERYTWLLERYRPVATISRTPLKPGRQFGFALREPKPPAAAHSTGPR